MATVCYTEGAMEQMTIRTKGPVIGVCHICKDLAPIEFCPKCGHWMCLGCQERLFWRGLEAVKKLLLGESLDCCGPKANVA